MRRKVYINLDVNSRHRIRCSIRHRSRCHQSRSYKTLKIELQKNCYEKEVLERLHGSSKLSPFRRHHHLLLLCLSFCFFRFLSSLCGCFQWIITRSSLPHRQLSFFRWFNWNRNNLNSHEDIDASTQHSLSFFCLFPLDGLEPPAPLELLLLARFTSRWKFWRQALDELFFTSRFR